MDRRAVIGGAIAAATLPATAQAATLEGLWRNAVTQGAKRFEQRTGGRLGLSLYDTHTRFDLGWRDKERFAMCSTFKWVLAARVLRGVEVGEWQLADPLPVPTPLVVYSPIVEAEGASGTLSIEACLRATVQFSDNTAANMLLTLIGGPFKLNTYAQSQKVQAFRLDRIEPDLNSNLPGDERDTVTPAAMTQLLRRLLLDAPDADGIGEDSRTQLLGWMKASRTGNGRLRNAFPEGFSFADKTGTGMNGATNIVGLIWPPDRRPLVFSAYASGSKLPVADINAAMRDLFGKLLVKGYSV